ncbi:SDR family oxidoreductase [bacterium]|jgi:dTDP-4-dehydrorhamnose reductase|nr:SDR family oxidoreductase [bacterium]
MARILITGAGGLLTPYLVEAASKYGEVLTSSRNNGDFHCDLSNPHEVKALLNFSHPDWVIHSAGYTDVDECQKYPTKAEKSNFHSAINLANSLNSEASLVVISTDQVYPDTKGLHKEENTGPVNIYGSTKLLGERSLLKHNRTVVLRTNMFGKSKTKNRSSIDDFMIGKMKGQSELVLFSDLLFSPLHMSTIADLILLILSKSIFGVYNLGSRNGVSKADFGFMLANYFELSTAHVSVGKSSDFLIRAPRAKDLRLDVNRIEKALGISMPTLQKEIYKL